MKINENNNETIIIIQNVPIGVKLAILRHVFDRVVHFLGAHFLFAPVNQ